MKQSLRTAARTALLAVTIFLLSASSLTLGQSKSALIATGDYSFSEREIKDLETGIKSDNVGLRKSAVYYAGIYQVKETAPVLVEQLKKEEDPDVKILISLVLFRLDDAEGMKAVSELAVNADDKEVKRMSTAIVNEFNKKNFTASSMKSVK